MKRVIFYILLLMSVTAKGQEVLSQAQTAFDMGHFEQLDTLLLNNMDEIKGEGQITAYRLLALSSLYQDKPAEAELYAGKLLTLDPYYTAYGESPRFVDILERLKKGKTMVTTASRVEETPEEVPVPVTLITEEMIQASGARTLSELLLLYVPGMSAIGSVEDNMAMRGVYGLTQEHMLVMLNGHRLNSFSTNAEAFDFRQNLEKIKQIEVLRGPASSLYGNVALTAVVNIITKSGSEIEGLSLTAKAGLNNSYGGTLLFGEGNLRTDVLAWASLYTSRGEKRWENNTLRYIGGYNNKPSYDLGMNVRWGDFTIAAIGQHSKTVPYYNLVDFDNYFTYDKYDSQEGEKPGISRMHVGANLDYTHTFGNLTISASAFATSERVQIYNVLGDTVNPFVASALLFLFDMDNTMPAHTVGVWQSVHWEDYSMGGMLNATYKYRMSENMYGSLLGGIQYDYFKLSDSSLNLGHDFNKVHLTTNTIFTRGDEQMASAFVQLKHNFTKRLIFNGGVRFDHKQRNDHRNINTVSPRAALIYIPNSTFSIKGTYAHSFVDAPFLYRAADISIFTGSENMDPEHMDAIQVSATLNLKPINTKCELNVFYTDVRDLVFYTSNDLNAHSLFENAGNISMGGVEGVIQYITPKTLLNLNMTYQYPFKVENFSSPDHNVCNISHFLLNLVGSQRLFSTSRLGSFWVRANMHFQTGMKCLDNDLKKSSPDPNISYITIDQSAVAIFGAGLEWKLPFRLTAAFDTYNLFNTHYKIGGRLQQGNPSQGFSFLGRLTYDF